MRGSIQKRGEQSWRIRIYAGVGPDGRKRYVARTVRGDRAEADRALARLLLEVGDGRHQGDESTTVAQLLDAWIEFAERDLAVTTGRERGTCLRVHLKLELGQVRLWQLRAVDRDRAYRGLAAGGLDSPRVVSRATSFARPRGRRPASQPVRSRTLAPLAR